MCTQNRQNVLLKYTKSAKTPTHVETSKGNKISFSISNGAFWDDSTYGGLVPEDSFGFVRGNGSGIYFYQPIQNVLNVTTTFSFSDSEDNTLSLSFADVSSGFQNQANITSRSGDPVGSPVTDNRYLTYWYTGMLKRVIVIFNQ